MGYWQLYEAGSKKLSRLLRHIEELLPPAGLALCSLQQLQCSIKDFEVSDKTLFFQLHTLNASSELLYISYCISYLLCIPQWTQEQLQLHEELYSQTVEAGRQIIPLTDAHTQTCLQSELDAFMETWERCCVLVEKRKALTDTITHVCDPILTSLLTFSHLVFYRGVMVQVFVPKIFSTGFWFGTHLYQTNTVLF